MVAVEYLVPMSAEIALGLMPLALASAAKAFFQDSNPAAFLPQPAASACPVANTSAAATSAPLIKLLFRRHSSRPFTDSNASEAARCHQEWRLSSQEYDDRGWLPGAASMAKISRPDRNALSDPDLPGGWRWSANASIAISPMPPGSWPATTRQASAGACSMAMPATRPMPR